MKTIVQRLDEAIVTAIKSAFGVAADPLVGVSQNDKFGDYQCNAAMGLAKVLARKTDQKISPRQVAGQIVAKLELHELADEISIAGPGFINIRLKPAWLADRLAQTAADDRLGIETVACPRTIVVDYSGPNIAKELHVGHLRSTIIGDAVSRVLEFAGHHVIRQNHIGDWGTQFGMLITELRRHGSDAAHIADLEAFYVRAKKHFDDEPDFAAEARQTVVKLQGGGAGELSLWQRIVDETRAHYQPLYGRLGVKLTQEHERGESFYNNKLPDVVADLKAAGIAEESDGATVVKIEGHESPLIIEKTGGGYLYGTTDLAAIRYRVGTLHADRIVYLVDARQSQHFAQVFAAAKRASWVGEASLEHAAFGTMLGEDGKPFKTRTGGVVKLADLLDEAEGRALAVVKAKNPQMPEPRQKEIARAVGIGSVKYADLSKDRISDYVFSFDKMLALDGNTAPYLQYAYARIRAIGRKAGGGGVQGSGIRLEAAHEVSLAKHVLRLGEVLELVAREDKPHHLCSYLYDLAVKFSGFYENCPVIQSEEPTRSSRLALCDVTARTLALGLELLGIEHPEQM